MATDSKTKSLFCLKAALEKKAENPDIAIPEELKRFHDESGHRIKFNKGDLNFTYGIAITTDADGCVLEVSVNNKVPNFNYGELVRRLSGYYEEAKSKQIEGPKKLKRVRNCDLFLLPEDLHNSVSVEQREGKADIIRLAFGVLDEHLEDLVADPPAFMDVVHQYCVAPLRRIYAEVFRTKRR